MARFVKIKSVSPKLGQDQTAKQLGFSISTLPRNRQDINMFQAVESYQ